MTSPQNPTLMHCSMANNALNVMHQDGFGVYVVLGAGQNAHGNQFCVHQYAQHPVRAYHYINSNGSVYYQNPDRSLYFIDANGYQSYSPPAPPGVARVPIRMPPPSLATPGGLMTLTFGQPPPQVQGDLYDGDDDDDDIEEEYDDGSGFDDGEISEDGEEM